jgi:hypothetical protein
MTSDIVALKDIDNPQGFYVYVHLRADTLEPFYVGKGEGGRAWRTNRTPHWQNIARRHGVKTKILMDGLQEWAALEMEIELIALYGRKDNKQGPLVNFTDGGQGVSGRVLTQASRTKMSNSAKARSYSPEQKEALGLRAKKLWENPAKRNALVAKQRQFAADPENRRANSERTRAYFANPSNRQKSKEARDFQMQPVVCNGLLTFRSIGDAADWVLRKKPSVRKHVRGNISNAASGRVPKAYGYRWAYADNPAPL